MQQTTTSLQAADFDNHDTADTHYSNKRLDPKTTKIVINETVIRQVNRTPVDIQKWRQAHIVAESRYYPNRTWLYNLYDDSLLDGHLDGVIDKRFDTVLNKTLVFKRNNKLVPELEKLITSAKFRMACRVLLETKAWGISGIEFRPGPDFDPAIIPRKHIKPKWQIIATEEQGNTGIDYTSLANVIITGEPEDLGFLLKCVPYVIYKRNAVADWAQYIEIFGQPIRIMYYEATDNQVKLELKKVLDDSGSSLALMIPKGVEFDVKDGKQSNGDGKLQSSFIDFLNQELSVIVLGNTETTTNGKTGSQAKSKVHQDQQEEITKGDMAYLIACLNNPQFLRILQSYGYPVEGGQFKHTREISIEYLAQRIAIDTQIPKSVPIPDDYWYNTYAIDKPDNYDELKKKLEESTQTEPDSNNPAPKPKAKPTRKGELHSPRSPHSPLKKPSKLRNLVNALSDFFAQAR
jgi:hypothetical protein